MKMNFKKILSILLVAMMTLSLVACGPAEDDKKDVKKDAEVVEEVEEKDEEEAEPEEEAEEETEAEEEPEEEAEEEAEAEEEPEEEPEEEAEEEAEAEEEPEEEAEAEEETEEEAEEEVNEDSHYPVTVMTYDHDGNEVETVYEKAPEKVIAVYQGSIETMIALGLEDHVYKCYGLDNEVKPEWKEGFEKMNYQDDVFAPDKETVLMDEPDMLFSWNSLFSDKKLGSAPEWIDRGVNVYINTNTVYNGNPFTLENEYKDILNMGRIFDVEDRAEALVDEMKNTIESVKEEVKDEAPVRVAVLEPEGDGGLRNYGYESLGGDMVKNLGGELCFPENCNIDKEALVAENPDVIFIVYMAYAGDDVDAVMESQMAAIRDEEAFAKLNAVENDRLVLIMLGDMYAAGPRTKDGIEHFAEGMYPELFAEEEVEEIAEEPEEEAEEVEEEEEEDEEEDEEVYAQRGHKPVLLVTSFGTSFNETRKETIEAVEAKLEEVYGEDYDVRRAFTSQIIINKLKARDGLYIDDVEAALYRCLADGVTEVVVQPTHVIPGIEYNYTLDEVEPFMDKFDSITVGNPIFYCDEAYDEVLPILLAETEEYDHDNNVIVFMGHGTEHEANGVYGTIQEKLDEMGEERYVIGTVEGTPTLDDVIENLEAREDVDTVYLLPLMIVAGDHANNDMAGDEDDSWKSVLEEKGYDVECILKGLGSYEGIQELFVERVADAIGEEAEEKAEEAAADVKIVTDSADREVEIAGVPETVISMGPNMTEFIYALGLEDKLVGDTIYCDYPEAANEIEKIGTLYEPDFEKIAELDPDLALASTHVSDETLEQLTDMGIPVLMLYDEHHIDGLHKICQIFGEVFEIEDEAKALEDDIFDRIEAVKERVADEEPVRCYYVVGFGEGGDWTATGETFINEILEAGGAENIAKDAEGWSYSLEQLIEEDPEIILIPAWAEDSFGTEEPYDQLTAVKEGNVHVVDNNPFDRQGPRTPDAVETVADILHPAA